MSEITTVSKEESAPITNPTTDRPKVLFIPLWYPPLEDQTRVSGTFCREHIQAASLYDDVAVLAYSSRSQPLPTLNWERVDDGNIPTFYATYGHSPVPKTTYIPFKIHLRRAIHRAIKEWGRPDVIHTQDTYSYHVIKATQHLGIPCVISQHWTAFTRGTLSHRLIEQFRWAFNRAERILPSNKFAEHDYKKYDIEGPITWLPNTFDTKIFYARENGRREPWLLHVSGFTDQKRFPDIIKAFSKILAKHPEAILQVVGDSKNRKKMEALAESELPPSSFHFHGFLSKKEIAELMRQSAGFVFPSSAETFGCVLMEAMACGCPVLTTKVGGIPAVVRDGEGLFVEVGNIDEIADGMTRLLEGTHGIDLSHLANETLQRFSYEAVGNILHKEHLRASTNNKSS